ncbi:MAG: leucine-rich repeat domain-containing protein [Paramuribaculum sp.]|nr:leucine-rich repeat domain-containing protein [Paramuribaculum sp.]
MKKSLLVLLGALWGSLIVSAQNGVKIDGIVYTIHNMGTSSYASVAGVTLPAEERANIKILPTVQYYSRTYNVTELENGCFAGDTLIKNIELPSTLTTFNANAISGCVGIKKLIIPPSVTSICGSFCSNGGTYNKDYVDIEEFVFEDGDEALHVPTRFNSNVKKIYLGRNMTTKAENQSSTDQQVLFYDSQLDDVTIGPMVKQLPDRIFKMCKKLKTVKFSSDGLETIGKEAFYGCNNFSMGGFPASLVEIGDYAFSYTAVAKVEIGPNLKKIGAAAFKDSKVSEPKWPMAMGVINNAYISCKEIESIEIPEGFATIESEAFSDCTSLTSIQLPHSMRTIESKVFKNCNSLKSLSIPGDVMTVSIFFLLDSNIEHLVFEDSDNVLTVERMGNWSGYPPVHSVRYLYLGRYVSQPLELFTTSPIEMVKIGPVLTSLPDYFAGNEYIQSIVIPPNINSLEPETFSGCSSLKDVTLTSGVMTLPKKMFYNCESLESLILPPNINNIASNVFTGSGLKELYVIAARPPKAVHSPETSESTFSQEQYRNVILHVPAESYELYDSMMPWMLFSNIVKEDFSGIDSPIVDSQPIIDQAAPMEVYSISGMRVSNSIDNLPTGLYIVRQGSNVVKIAIN